MRPGKYKRREPYSSVQFAAHKGTDRFFVVEFDGHGVRLTIDFEGIGKKARNDIRKMLGAREK